MCLNKDILHICESEFKKIENEAETLQLVNRHTDNEGSWGRVTYSYHALTL